ncbi:MAG TPA: hypothetical protein VK835_03440 [Bacteroidia bacterium]|jgi:hypothetical protein|nr:hypothetical protein [Bacteroidia bacterium]
MKTQHFSTKMLGVMFLMALFYSQQTLAAVQDNFTAESHSDNVAIVICVLLFIIGFSVLIALKINDDKKHPNNDAQQNQSHGTPHNRHGHRHQHSH